MSPEQRKEREQPWPGWEDFGFGSEHSVGHWRVSRRAGPWSGWWMKQKQVDQSGHHNSPGAGRCGLDSRNGGDEKGQC
jgi:hypothetical protein